MMDAARELLIANKAWVAERLALQPDFFENFANGQSPLYLWIGCSDSRVPAEQITGTQPGELFVHRNIANLVVHTDFNMLSVLQYSVEILKVNHIIVCGHYGCGGVENAMSRRNLGLINKWLRQIKDVYRFHSRELDNIPDFQSKFDRLVELNVLEQVNNLVETSIVQSSWRSRQAPSVHGWVYDMKTGLLKDIATRNYDSHIEDIYRFKTQGEE